MIFTPRALSDLRGHQSNHSALSTGDNANVRQIPIALGVVQAVAHNEFIRNLEAHIVRFDGLLAPRGLIEQRGNFERPGLMGHQNSSQVSEREAGIEYVLDEDQIFVPHGMINIFGQADLTGRIPSGLQLLSWAGAIAIAGNADEIESRIQVHLASKIAEENGRSFQHSDEDDAFAAEVASDLVSDFGYTVRDLFALQQHFQVRHAH